MAAELTAKLAFCSVLERSFDDIVVCEWIQTGVKNTKNRRFLNMVLTTSLYVNGCGANCQIGVLIGFGT